MDALVILSIINVVLLGLLVYSSHEQENSIKRILLLIKGATDDIIPESPDKFDLKIVNMGRDDKEENINDVPARIIDSNSIWEEDALSAEEIEKS